MTEMKPELFDRYMELGWRALGYSMVRHNSIELEGKRLWTVPLRIRMDGFQMTARQRKLVRRHISKFSFMVQAIRLTEEKEQLFQRHCQRFVIKQDYESLAVFITEASDRIPVPGYEIEVFDGDKLVACSYFHVGANCVNATYCFFDPDYTQWSLGSFTMLVELQIAMQLGKQYYYTGYAHTTPSQFDYKFNFNNVEELEWANFQWYPRPRASSYVVSQTTTE